MSRQHGNNNRTITGQGSAVNDFDKAKDALRVRGRFWDMMLMMFYLNVFYLPTLKDFVGHYKLWNEVMIWFTQMMCYNVYIPLLIRPDRYVQK